MGEKQPQPESKVLQSLMVSIGSKTLVSRSSMGEHDYEPLKQGKTKRRKHKKGGSTHAFDSNSFTSPPQLSRVRYLLCFPSTFYVFIYLFNLHFLYLCRKQLDPETTQYFSEISNLFESDGVELEDRSLICANALEETKGKEFEIATDYILSHTLETILQGCDVHHLCDFLHTSANHFPYIAMDRSGSHVAETSIKSLAVHLQDDDDVVRPLVEEALTMICKVVTHFILLF